MYGYSNGRNICIFLRIVIFQNILIYIG